MRENWKLIYGVTMTFIAILASIIAIVFIRIADDQARVIEGYKIDMGIPLYKEGVNND